MWNAFMGWIGVDQYDEANPLSQDFLDRYAKRYGGRRPEYCVPPVNHDVAATLVRRAAMPIRSVRVESKRRWSG